MDRACLSKTHRPETIAFRDNKTLSGETGISAAWLFGTTVYDPFRAHVCARQQCYHGIDWLDLAYTHGGSMLMEPPAYRLKGLDLQEGWHVEERIEPPPGATGGNFSCGYRVRRSDGARGFLKALDFSRALREKDPARALLPLL